jgi:membrane protein DedA with SNARE-associated domain
VALLRDLLLRHGHLFVFAYILIVQAGVPVPADPLLLVMGTLIREGYYSVPATVAVSAIAAVLGDSIWFELGRRRGNSVLRLLCRFSLEPDTCVRKSENAFAKNGARTLLFSKFVPGLSLVSVPMAALSGMPRWRFLLYDLAGSIIWTGTYVGLGIVFAKEIQRVLDFIGQLGRGAGLFVLGLLALYTGVKWLRRWKFVHDLRVRRIQPQALLEMLNSAQKVCLIDLRHEREIERDGMKLPGAQVWKADEVRSRSGEIPRDQEIILYCS